ncbi:MAG: MATE family efflux transporter [Deltaproteobacteria bacterium]|nr:MATE family efflux transporter [Deltaproteobacteria bacterium]
MTTTDAPQAAPPSELRTLVRLALPLMAAQVGMMMLGVAETVIVGRAGTIALGAVSLGNVWTHGTILMAMGVVMGADPILSQAYGAGDARTAALTFQRGLVLSLLLGLPVSGLWLGTRPVLELFGQDAELSRLAAVFVAVQAPTAFGFLVFTIARQYLAGRGVVWPSLWVVLVVNAINAPLTWWLVFGGTGLSPAAGAGVAGAIVRLLLPGLLLAVIFWTGLHRPAWTPWERASFDWRRIGRIVWLGLPIGLHYGFEVWAFQLATLLAGRLGPVPLGAHAIVLNLATLSFMFPLGISTAAAVRVGNLIGAGDEQGARRAANLSLLLGVGVMACFGAAFFLLRGWLPRLYGAEPAVAELCARVLPIAAAFQMLDGTQVVASGILRGLGRTKPAAVFNLVGYYFLALPLAYLLALHGGLGLEGVWWGLAAGLLVVAAGLLTLVLRRTAYHTGRAQV